jgi:hypothetical protein
MICRRAAALGIAEGIGWHTFRATGITAYLANGGALKHAQEIAAHQSRVEQNSMTEPKSVLPKTRWKELGYDRLVHFDSLPRDLHRMIMKKALLALPRYLCALLRRAAGNI